jgi:hypothetical protein
MNKFFAFLMSISWVPPVVHLFWHPIAHAFGLPCP